LNATYAILFSEFSLLSTSKWLVSGYSFLPTSDSNVLVISDFTFLGLYTYPTRT